MRMSSNASVFLPNHPFYHTTITVIFGILFYSQFCTMVYRLNHVEPYDYS